MNQTSTEAWSPEELKRRLDRLQERRGESIEETMSKAGPRFFTKAEAYAAAARACDAEGIDPTLELSERTARLRDIHQGSQLMFEERKRKESYVQAASAKKFHDTLREKLGQV